LNKDCSWIVFSYKVPSEPSTIRVRVWRTLKALGVIYIQQSVCVAPDTPDVRKKVYAIQKLIESSEGEALLLEVNKFAEITEEQLWGLFNKQRITEYNELMESCNNFLKEIFQESIKGNFTYHEVEENEAELGKLKRWQKKIMKRDFFCCANSEKAKHLLDQCEQSFNEFTKKVYATEGKNEGQI
jgi:ribosomal protein L30/L7E